MTAARLTGGIYLAAISAIVVAFALSWRAPNAPQPRLQISWSLGSLSSAAPVQYGAAPAVQSRSRQMAAIGIRKTPDHVHSIAVAPAGSASPPPTRENAEVARVEERLKDSLTQDLYDNFRLFLYVSKAANGPWAQQMYVFRKERDGAFELLYRWPVSTGREKMEATLAGDRVSTRTPAGYYELDPHRFYRHHVSSQWHQPMPFAMFFNHTDRGRLTGVAIHSATGSDIAVLGRRASAGCIHLSPEAARTLYTLIRKDYRGPVPRFAIDRAGTMSSEGIVLHDLRGHPRMAPGYKVLVFIEDYGGRNVIAAIY